MAKKRDIYTIGGEQVPGASAIKDILAKEALLPWAVKMAVQHIEKLWQPGIAYDKGYIKGALHGATHKWQERRDTAGDFGNVIHGDCGAYVEGQLLPEDIKEPERARALRNFILVTKDWKWLGSEIVVTNSDLMYGGTADAIAELPSGMIVLVDFKTSGGVWPEFSIQCALYALGTPRDRVDLREAWKKIEEARILHFDKELLTWQVLERSVKDHYPYLIGFCQVHRWKKKYGQHTYSSSNEPKADIPEWVNAPQEPSSEIFIA